MKIGIVVGKFNEEVTQKLYVSTVERLHDLGIKKENIDTIWVPSAVEIPATAQELICKKRYQAIICLGAVIRGDTDHYDYVCQQVSYGCQKIAIKHRIPVIFGILTTNTSEQALERVINGAYLANTALEMIETFKKIENL